MGRIRNTKQKNILDEEVKKFNKYFTAEELHEKVSNKGIGQATVYRYLKEKGLHSYLCDRRTIYSNKKISHCHFIDENTGKIIHFDVDSIDFLKNKIPGEITSFQIEVKGISKE
jgi:Fe2+ or Zn2+ uptake regulation protein